MRSVSRWCQWLKNQKHSLGISALVAVNQQVAIEAIATIEAMETIATIEAIEAIEAIGAIEAIATIEATKPSKPSQPLLRHAISFNEPFVISPYRSLC